MTCWSKLTRCYRDVRIAIHISGARYSWVEIHWAFWRTSLWRFQLGEFLWIVTWQLSGHPPLPARPRSCQPSMQHTQTFSSSFPPKTSQHSGFRMPKISNVWSTMYWPVIVVVIIIIIIIIIITHLNAQDNLSNSVREFQPVLDFNRAWYSDVVWDRRS